MVELDKALLKEGLHGRGGTDMKAGFEWLREQQAKPTVFITLTDGWTDWPTAKPAYPTVVVSTDKNKSGPYWARTLHV